MNLKTHASYRLVLACGFTVLFSLGAHATTPPVACSQNSGAGNCKQSAAPTTEPEPTPIGWAIDFASLLRVLEIELGL